MRERNVLILRYGAYINKVPKNALKGWLEANLICNTYDGAAPQGLTLEELCVMAKEKGYSFREVGGVTAERLDACLGAAKIEKVAKRLMTIAKRGDNYVFRCPICGGEGFISPKRGIFKCFGCGESGNAIHLVMHLKGYDYEGALEWIEKTYKIKYE